MSFKELGWFGPLRVTLSALLSLMSDMETLSLAQMQWLGECPQPLGSSTPRSAISRGDAPPGGKWFTLPALRRTPRGLTGCESTCTSISPSSEVENFRRMDDPGIIKNIYAIARLAAEIAGQARALLP